MQGGGVGGNAQCPVLLVFVQRFSAFAQFALTRRAIVDLLDHAGVLDRTHGVGGDRGEGELLGQLQARAGHLQQLQQAVGAVLVEEEVVEADLLQLPDVLDHAPGFFGRQVQPVFPQVAVFQAGVFGHFFPVGHQGEQAGVAAHQAFPGVQHAVVGAFDKGTEVQRVAEHGAAVAVDVGLVDAQQGVAEHRRWAVEVGRREDQHRAMGRDVAVPGAQLVAGGLRQVAQLQLFTQPAAACGEYALGVLLAKAGGRIQGLQGGAQFGFRLGGTVVGEEESAVVDIAAPAAQFAGLVMAEGNPVRVVGQAVQAGVSKLWLRSQGRAGAQRQKGKQAFEHGGHDSAKQTRAKRRGLRPWSAASGWRCEPLPGTGA